MFELQSSPTVATHVYVVEPLPTAQIPVVHYGEEEQGEVKVIPVHVEVVVAHIVETH